MRKTYSHHYSHRGLRKHRVSALRKFLVYVLPPVLIVLLSVFLSAKFFSARNIISTGNFFSLFLALGASFLRLSISYIISLVLGVLLALLATSSKKLESFLLPLFDTLESLPILVFFPVIILFFISYKLFNLAAVFIIFLNMLWNIVFSSVSGIKLIPQDILSVGKVFGLGRLKTFSKIILPSIFPYIVTGSLLAWAEGWNMLIVAEVLGTYVPKTSGVENLFGIGSTLVEASVSGNSGVFFGAVTVIVLSIILINIFIWQKLLRFSEKYKFDS